MLVYNYHICKIYHLEWAQLHEFQFQIKFYELHKCKLMYVIWE